MIFNIVEAVNVFFIDPLKVKPGRELIMSRSDLEGCEVVESRPGTLREMVVRGDGGQPKRRIVVMSGSNPQ